MSDHRIEPGKILVVPFTSDETQEHGFKVYVSGDTVDDEGMAPENFLSPGERAWFLEGPVGQAKTVCITNDSGTPVRFVPPAE